ncbi:MAG: hypothetical protein ACRERC_00070 [Candidatus Binatia bacterium]
MAATDLAMRSGLLHSLRPQVLSPADGAIVNAPVSVSWNGPQPLQATLTGNGQRVDLGLRESPFEIDSARFPRPGQYGIELRSPRFGVIGADRRFMVRRARPERSTDSAVPDAAAPPAGAPPANDGSLARLQAALESARQELALARQQLQELREDNDDVGDALDELQADTDARLAAADTQREELTREHLLALQENQLLRLRLESIPPCTAWGYLMLPRPQTAPPSRFVVVSNRAGAVFRSELDCARARRADPSGVSACVCVGSVWGGP